MKNVFLFIIIFFYSNISNAIEFRGKFEQGSFIIGKATKGSKVEVDNRKIRLTKDGYFAFGLDRDRKNNVVIKIHENGKTEVIERKILKRDYKIQKIDGLPKKQVTPPPEVYERIKKDNILIGKARSIDTAYDYFKDKFIKPIDKYIITGVYGSQRILNGKPRRPHYGIDFHAPEGTPIKAMMDGKITLAERDMYFTGGTIIFDHGHGISTLYMHMKNVNVKVGQKVKQGDIVGTLGKKDSKNNIENKSRFFYFSNFILIISIYGLIMSILAFAPNYDATLKNLIVIPLIGQMIHFYLDTFLWRFKEQHHRDVTYKYIYQN
jgi:murein DD-endopeptidase MepM/ murein hydrolase activator NlpD